MSNKRRSVDDPGAAFARRFHNGSYLVSSEDSDGSSAPRNARGLLSFLPDNSSSQDESSEKHGSAASDGAVAGVSEHGSSNQAAEESTALSFPTPKNFAERLMTVLEKGIASDSIWWVDEIKGVALQPKKLKKGTLLTSHFSGNKYPAFLRSFNRWGFRRVPYQHVPDGAVIYKNCLFRMDEPHLVKHMRMDSNVQDVFEQHQMSSDSTRSSTSSSRSPTRAKAAPPAPASGFAAAPAPQGAAVGGMADALKQMFASQSGPKKQESQPNQNQDMSSLLQNFQGILNQPAPPNQFPLLAKLQELMNAAGGNSNQQSAVATSGAGQQQAMTANQQQPMSANRGLMASSSSSQQNLPLVATSQSSFTPMPAPAPEGASTKPPNNDNNNIASTLALLVQQLQGQQSQPPQVPYRDTLLQQLLDTAKEYNEQPQSPSTHGPAIRISLELLIVLGQQELQHSKLANNQGQPRSFQ